MVGGVTMALLTLLTAGCGWITYMPMTTQDEFRARLACKELRGEWSVSECIYPLRDNPDPLSAAPSPSQG